MNKHRGGTLLGFILGLLVGLGAALAVAVYVTKVPIPLVDRGLQSRPDRDAQEQARNKDWNPNAGLASKTVPLPAPVEGGAVPSAPAASSEPPRPTPAPAVAAPEAGKITPAAKPAKDPLGELIDSRADASAPKPEPFIYFVQAGAFRGPEEAETQRAKLAMQGFDFKVSEREQAGRLVYRLRLGPYRSKAEADQTQERLVAQGVEAALVRSQR
ncbi:MAG: hypothetical protein RLZZ22_1419 [Pseudomonadota bacterium]|jgi:cell division protein FtsN